MKTLPLLPDPTINGVRGREMNKKNNHLRFVSPPQVPTLSPLIPHKPDDSCSQFCWPLTTPGEFLKLPVPRLHSRQAKSGGQKLEAGNQASAMFKAPG